MIIHVKTDCHKCKEETLLKNAVSTYCKFCQGFMGRIDVFLCLQCYKETKEEHDRIHHQSVELV